MKNLAIDSTAIRSNCVLGGGGKSLYPYNLAQKYALNLPHKLYKHTHELPYLDCHDFALQNLAMTLYVNLDSSRCRAQNNKNFSNFTQRNPNGYLT